VGYTGWKLGDLDESLNTFKMDYAQWPEWNVTGKTPGGSFDGRLGADLTYRVAGNHQVGLGLGWGSYCGGTSEMMTTYQNYHTETGSDILDLSGSALSVNLFYQRPCCFCPRALWRAGVGLDFNSSRIKYDQSWNSESYPFFDRGTLRDKGIGTRVFVGASFSVIPNLEITGSVGYTSNKMNDFTGTLTNSNDEQRDMRLTMEHYTNGYGLGLQPLDQPLTNSSRSAEIDMSGFNIRIGLRYDLTQFLIRPKIVHSEEEHEQ
jgi:hypothetical protein